MKTWEDVAEHYRRAMLDAEAILRAIPARAHPVAVAVDLTAMKISEAAHTLWQARQDALMLYYRELPDK